MTSKTQLAQFVANISYYEIYPACDLVLYEKGTEGLESFKELTRSKDNIKEVNGRFSLFILIHE